MAANSVTLDSLPLLSKGMSLLSISRSLSNDPAIQIRGYIRCALLKDTDEHAVRQLIAKGYPVKREDLAALSPHQTRHIKRFGDHVFTVTAPEPFDAELIRPFPLEAESEAQSAIA